MWWVWLVYNLHNCVEITLVSYFCASSTVTDSFLTFAFPATCMSNSLNAVSRKSSSIAEILSNLHCVVRIGNGSKVSFSVGVSQSWRPKNVLRETFYAKVMIISSEAGTFLLFNTHNRFCKEIFICLLNHREYKDAINQYSHTNCL